MALTQPASGLLIRTRCSGDIKIDYRTNGSGGLTAGVQEVASGTCAPVAGVEGTVVGYYCADGMTWEAYINEDDRVAYRPAATQEAECESSGPAVVPSGTDSPSSVFGNLMVGDIVAALPFTWQGTQPVYETVEWNLDGASFSSEQAFKVEEWMLGQTLTLIRYGSNPAGSDQTQPVTIGVMGEERPGDYEPPTNTQIPSITGGKEVGNVLYGNMGQWNLTEVPEVALFEWLADDEVVLTQALGEEAELTLTEAMIGKNVVYRVTFGRMGNTNTASSLAHGPIVAAEAGGPVALTHPHISGVLYTGNVLSCDVGTWNGGEEDYATVQWKVDGVDVASDEPNPRQLRLSAAWIGKRVTAFVTVENETASTTEQATGAEGFVIARAPINTIQPTLIGDMIEGKTLTGTTGEWDQVTGTYTWAWSIDGEVAQAASSERTFIIPSGTNGGVVTMTVTLSNESGTGTVDVEGYAPIESPFANFEPPTITGKPEVGVTLTCSNGSWSQEPTQVVLQWLVDGADSGAGNTNELLLSEAHLGKMITVLATATYNSETAQATSPAIGPVTGPVPNCTKAPSIEGVAKAGAMITVIPAVWDMGGLEVGYNWFIDGAPVIVPPPGTEYAITNDDVGKYITVEETVRVEAAGQESPNYTSPLSNEIGPVLALTPPENIALPTISGTPAVGQTLTASNGTWTNDPTEFTYRWYVVNKDEVVATTPTFLIDSRVAVGDELTIWVTALNDDGENTAEPTSGVTIMAANVKPVNTVAPGVTGEYRVPEIITVDSGSWTGENNVYSVQWMRNGVNIDGATAWNYELVAEDAGNVVNAKVTATNEVGATTINAVALPGVVEANIPRNLTQPVITGVAEIGEVLTTTNGTWENANAYTRQWKSGGAAIAGATGLTWVVPGAALGSTITVTVTALNENGSAEATSEAFGPIVESAGEAPVNTVAPSISGEPKLGETLTADPGEWENATGGFTFTWFRESNSEELATGQTYVVAAPVVVGDKVFVRVDTSNDDGGSDAVSDSVTIVAEEPTGPINTVAPVVTGTAKVWQRLSSTLGTWTGANSFVTYWQADGVDVGNLIGTDIIIPPELQGKVIRSKVRASDGNNETFAYSAPTAVVGPANPVVVAPSNTVKPTIIGVPSTSGAVSAEIGTWAGDYPMTFTYQWYANFDLIEGATNKSFAPTAAQSGKLLRVFVTATNTAGTATESSTWTNPVNGGSTLAPPALVEAPSPEFSGEAITGGTLTAGEASWSGDELETHIVWLKDGKRIPGETEMSLDISWDWANAVIGYALYATNAAGTDIFTSGDRIISGAPPENLTVPTITGVAKVGEKLTAAPGTWSGPTPQYTYQWYVANEAILGATGNEYIPLASQIGLALKVSVRATNAYGYDSAESVFTDPVVKADGPVVIAPINATPPTLMGGTTVGQIISGANGTWTGGQPMTFAYAWKADGVVINGAITNKYTLQAGQVGKHMTLTVTATNEGGSTDATSAPSETIKAGNPPAGTVLEEVCEGTTLVRITANGQGGTYPVYISKSEECGYVPIPENEVDDKIEEYKDSNNATLKNLAIVLGCYRDRMGFTTPCEPRTVHEMQLQLWACLRAAVFEQEAFRDCMDFILLVFRENRDNAFELPNLLRTVDMVGTRLNGDQRAAYVGLMNVYTWAGRLNDLSEVPSKVDLNTAISDVIFSNEARMRLIGYFEG